MSSNLSCAVKRTTPETGKLFYREGGLQQAACCGQRSVCGTAALTAAPGTSAEGKAAGGGALLRLGGTLRSQKRRSVLGTGSGEFSVSLQINAFKIPSVHR